MVAAAPTASFSRDDPASLRFDPCMTLLAFEGIDLIAFIELGLAGVLLTLVLVGMAAWLRERSRKRDSGYYPGL